MRYRNRGGGSRNVGRRLGSGGAWCQFHGRTARAQCWAELRQPCRPTRHIGNRCRVWTVRLCRGVAFAAIAARSDLDARWIGPRRSGHCRRSVALGDLTAHTCGYSGDQGEAIGLLLAGRICVDRGSWRCQRRGVVSRPLLRAEVLAASTATALVLERLRPIRWNLSGMLTA